MSYALRGLHVPQETQDRVRQAAEELGYQVNPIARALASGSSGYVGILCRSLQDVWLQDVTAAIGRRLMGSDRHALLVDCSNDRTLEERLARQLIAQRVDALVCVPVDPRGAFWKELATQTVLVSLGDALPAAPTAASVVFDNAAAVTDALTRLAAAGHRRIAVLTPIGLSTPDRPAESVVRSLAPSLGVTAELTQCPHDLDGAAAVAGAILDGARPPTAILCLADVMAFGVYLAARGRALSIGQDLSVIGFDDHRLAQLMSPPLTSYRWPFESIVDEVAGRTIAAIEHGRRFRRLTFSAQIQLRESFAPEPHP